MKLLANISSHPSCLAGSTVVVVTLPKGSTSILLPVQRAVARRLHCTVDTLWRCAAKQFTVEEGRFVHTFAI